MADRASKARRKFLAIKALADSKERIGAKLGIEMTPFTVRKFTDRELAEIVTLENISQFLLDVEASLPGKQMRKAKPTPVEETDE